jgi:tetratricopeptide (TPR) repeat protein
MLLLSGDRGDADLDAVISREPHALSHHGSFSLPVNYHAIGELFRRRGGSVLATRRPGLHLTVGGYLLGPDPGGYRATVRAFERAMNEGGPDDFFTLRRCIRDHGAQLGFDALLALVRASRYDPRVLRDCAGALAEHVREARATSNQELVRVVLATWQNYYAIGEDDDLPFALGQLLCSASAFEEALALFARSLEIHGEDHGTRWNMGLCLLRLGRWREATPYLAAAAEAIGPETVAKRGW